MGEISLIVDEAQYRRMNRSVVQSYGHEGPRCCLPTPQLERTGPYSNHASLPDSDEGFCLRKGQRMGY